MFGLGFSELLLILFIVLILFGAKNLPDLAKSLGKTLGAFKKGVRESEEDLKNFMQNGSDTESKNSGKSKKNED